MNSNYHPSPRPLPLPPAGEYDEGFANLYLRTDDWLDRDGTRLVFVVLTIDGPNTSFTVSAIPLYSLSLLHSLIDCALAAAADHGP